MQFKKVILKAILMTGVGLMLNACTPKEYQKQESVFIVFKTPTFKHADLGFIYENDEEIKVEIYSSGQNILSLDVSKSAVCLSLLECMGKKSFNKEVLSRHYPKSILEDIFKGQKIFDGAHAVATRNGFTQNISKKNKYNIKYSVLNKQIIFRDTINDILIKVKRL